MLVRSPNGIEGESLDHPDELLVELDPVPGVKWPQVRKVGLAVHEE